MLLCLNNFKHGGKEKKGKKALQKKKKGSRSGTRLGGRVMSAFSRDTTDVFLMRLGSHESRSQDIEVGLEGYSVLLKHSFSRVSTSLGVNL